jgi:hypothetical protein
VPVPHFNAQPWLSPVTEEMVDGMPRVVANLRVPAHGQVVIGWDLIIENPPVTTRDTGGQVGFLNLRVFGPISGSVLRQQPPRPCVLARTATPGETRCVRQPDGSMVEVWATGMKGTQQNYVSTEQLVEFVTAPKPRVGDN